MKNNQRKVKNLIIDAKFQLRLCFFYGASGLLFFGVVVGLAMTKMNEVREMMNSNTEMNFQVQMQVNDLMLEAIQITLAGFVLYIIFTSLFSLFMSHRIAGPVVAIISYINELKKGNYDYKRELRPNDELTQIMMGLKDLAPILKEKS